MRFPCYGLTEQQMSEGNLDGPIVNRLQEWVRKLLAQQIDPLARIDELVEGRDLVILCDEVGCGVVPIDPAQREWREAVGRVCCALAQKAGVCRPGAVRDCHPYQGGTGMSTLVLIRHGKTAGNLQKRYIGRTDEPLCPEGKKGDDSKADALSRRPARLFESPVALPSDR